MDDTNLSEGPFRWHHDQEPLIRIQDLRRDFPMGHEIVHALDGVSLTVEEGEFLDVMGPSGSGKSTLLYLMGGLDRPTAGHIWVRDQDITALDENGLATYRRCEIGFVFQSFHLIATMTAAENVEFPMLFARVPPAQRRERARRLLEMVGLVDRMGHKPTELSGGQQQRVAIARALVNDPGIVLADEPTGNLDSHTGAEVMDTLARLNQEQGRTIVVVSHDPAITKFASRCIHLLDGRIENINEQANSGPSRSKGHSVGAVREPPLHREPGHSDGTLSPSKGHSNMKGSKATHSDGT